MNDDKSRPCLDYKLVPNGHQQTSIRRSESLDNDTHERDVLNYVNNQANGRDTAIRSNSYSLQDMDRSRHGSERCINDPMFEYFHAMNAKSRRVSKSLPELRALKHFPLVASHYNAIDESDEDDEDSIVMQDIPAAAAWHGKSEFLFTGLGLALGLNNVWRFPYFCYKFGGSFLVVYLIIMFSCGLPLLAMEYAMGQLTRRGPIAAFGSLCPLLKGVPVAAACASLILAPLYSAINSWSLSYFFKSFYSVPLWAKCSNPWNSDNCIYNSTLVSGLLNNLMNTTVPNHHDLNSPYIDTEYDETDTTTQLSYVSNDNHTLATNESAMTFNQSIMLYATQEFFDNKLLELDLVSSTWGEIQWELFAFIIITWCAVFVTLRKNILFSSHPTYWLAIISVAIMVIMFSRAVALDGAKMGILYFLKPSWAGIRDSRVWLYAAGLCFHSLGSVIGISFAKATCNKERNNFLRDAFLICVINTAAILLIGCTIFATLGSLSVRRNIEIQNVAVDDPGMAFVIFSELLSTIPLTAMWSVSFFLILFCIGCDYQISVVAAFLLAIEDAYGLSIKKTFLSHWAFILLICLLASMTSLVFVSQKGILMITLVDQYVTVLLTLILAFFEIILIGWFYGGNNLSQVIKLKVTRNLSCYFPFSWNIIAPFSILFILGWNGYYFKEPLFRLSHSFPIFMQLIVHITVILMLLLIPIIAYRQIRKTPNTNVVIRILNACKPKEEQQASQIFEISGPGSRKPSSILIGQQVNSNPRSLSVAPSFIGSSTLKVPVTLSLIQGLDRETEI